MKAWRWVCERFTGFWLRWQVRRGTKTWGRQPQPKARAAILVKVKRAGSDTWEDLGELWKGDI